MLKKMTSSEVKVHFGDFIKSAQNEEVIIYKNGKPLLRVTPIKRTRKEAVSQLFDWGVKGLKDEDRLNVIMDKDYAR